MRKTKGSQETDYYQTRCCCLWTKERQKPGKGKNNYYEVSSAVSSELNTSGSITLQCTLTNKKGIKPFKSPCLHEYGTA
jgi:hypothetical protein